MDNRKIIQIIEKDINGVGNNESIIKNKFIPWPCDMEFFDETIYISGHSIGNRNINKNIALAFLRGIAFNTGQNTFVLYRDGPTGPVTEWH